MPKKKYKKFTKLDGGIEKVFSDSIIFEKTRWYYRETSDDGTLVVYFKSGLIYHFKNVKPKFAEVFLYSGDQEAGTIFNKYISSQFEIDKIIRSAKFTKMLEDAKKRDKAAKDKARHNKAKEKVNA